MGLVNSGEVLDKVKMQVFPAYISPKRPVIFTGTLPFTESNSICIFWITAQRQGIVIQSVPDQLDSSHDVQCSKLAVTRWHIHRSVPPGAILSVSIRVSLLQTGKLLLNEASKCAL